MFYAVAEIYSFIHSFMCKQCLSQFNSSDHLKRHKQSKHEDWEYPCNKCECVATDNFNSLRRGKSTHEGVEYTEEKPHQ